MIHVGGIGGRPPLLAGLGIHLGVWLALVVMLDVSVRVGGVLLAVLGVGGGARASGDGGIYMHIGVRVRFLVGYMVIVLAILQRHGRTLLLRHSSGGGLNTGWLI